MEAKKNRRWLRAAVMTACFLVMVAIAVSGGLTLDAVVLLVLVTVPISLFYLVFPGSHFFALSFANYATAYVCLFALVMESNFHQIDDWVGDLGFALPMIAFLSGALWRRAEIREIILDFDRRPRGRVGPMLWWLVPVLAIGTVTFFLPTEDWSRATHDVVFLVAMGSIAGFVLFVSKDVCVFLIDTGLMFEDFFAAIEELAIPTFAFITFYSMLVIVFACAYRIIDVYTVSTQFMILGEPQEIGFVDSLYFSIITLSTVGYGDIVPQTNLIRLIAAVQVVLGVLLLIFGVSEIRRFSTERAKQRRSE
jgi:voltage-gated potassium channel